MEDALKSEDIAVNFRRIHKCPRSAVAVLMVVATHCAWGGAVRGVQSLL